MPARDFDREEAAERAALGLLGSFATTVLAARAVNYVRERRRVMPRARSLVRRAQSTLRRDERRVHHFMPGIALVIVAGAGSVLWREDQAGVWFGLPFGSGAALTLDELAVLMERNNPYWGSERFAFAQAAVAAAGAGVLALRLHARTRARLPPKEGARPRDLRRTDQRAERAPSEPHRAS